ncbi:TraB/GumN family protein [Labilibaculum euxinus]
MKQLILFFSIYLLTINCKAQDSIVDYLNLVKQEFSLQEQLIPDSVVEKYNIVFIGETHGFNDNYKVAYKLIKEYKSRTDFTYLLAEMDWATSQKLNSYLLNEDTTSLKGLIDKTKSSPAWCKEKYDFYKKLINLNRQSENKILYVGVDIPAGGISNTVCRLIEIKEKYGEADAKLDSIGNNINSNQENIRYIKKLYEESKNKSYGSEDLFEYRYHLENILNYSSAIHTTSDIGWDKVRDSCIFDNYKKLESQLHLKNQKMIGVWGYSHTLQEPTDGVRWFAANLKDALKKKVYTYRIFYFDSKCMISEKWIPGLLKITKSKKKLYYNLNLQNDDNWVTGTKEKVKELRNVTPKNSIFVYDLTHNNSPFKSNPFLIVNRDLDWNTTDFFQTAIVVRNSKPTEPFGINKK